MSRFDEEVSFGAGSEDSQMLNSVLEFANKKYSTITLNFGDEDKLACGTTKILRKDLYSSSK